MAIAFWILLAAGAFLIWGTLHAAVGGLFVGVLISVLITVLQS